MARLDSCIEVPLRKEDIEEIIQKAKDWAIMNGISMRSPNFNTDEVQIAPFLLLPSTFPEEEFKKVVNLQTTLNELIHNVSYNYEFLKNCLSSTIETDTFTAKLFELYQTVENENTNSEIQVYSLGLLRSDYMLHSGFGNKIQQVELNTIASSFGGLSTVITKYHRFILATLGYSEKLKHIPENNSISGLCSGLIEAWMLYNNPEAVILFVTENKTYNISDQRFHEFQIHQLNPQIKILRRSLTDLISQVKLNSQKELYVNTHLVSVVYYRSAYDPSFYPTENEWTVRLKIEQSRAIKCPSIQYQLAGTKKVQQVLAIPGVLDQFVEDETKRQKLKEVFTGIYGLEFDEYGNKAVEMALKDPENFVLKPQREGGGHNVYGLDVKSHIEKLKNSKDRLGWILMDRIPPPSQMNYVIRAGDESSSTPKSVMSELGIYGVVLGCQNKIVINKQVGHLLRTKLTSSNEGGIIAGYGAMDSPYLVH